MAETVGMAGGGASAGLGGGAVSSGARPPSIHRDGDLIIAEESEKSSTGGSPSPTRGSPGAPRTTSTTPPLTQQQLHQQPSHLGNNNNSSNTSSTNHSQQQNVGSGQQHHPQSQSPGLGSPLGMLRGLQGLAGLPQLSQQMSQLAANLQGLASQAPLSNPPTAGLSSPLNLSVGGGGLNSSNNTSNSSTGGLLQSALPSPMPQLILASGQLVQGIQGAQLLIPTSQGIATQTILTIPVNQVSSNDQMVNLALNNGQVVSTSLANLQAMAQPHQLLNNQQSNNSAIRNSLLNQSANAALTNALLNPAALSGLLANGGVGAQQLLQAMQQQQPQNHLLSGHVPSQHMLQNNPSSLANQSLQGNQHSPSSNSWNDQSSQHLNQQRHYKDRDTPYHHQNSHGDSSFINDLSREKSSSRERERDRDSLTNGMNGSCSNQSAVAAAAALSSISRLAASNGELTITAARSTGSPSVGGGRTPPCKSSPASTEPEDLLADSPDQPTINQTSTNMVDGINLDDIKEFAKAFKLRRLSLGLTQTQVGQALSVTEGPAYSQSAICSALASQMFAAQLSTQQSNIFEKLDITPKSAQKIKPVLERWMKEAEERTANLLYTHGTSDSFSYASGQNHLTDFIGMEPSKKRKRRTSFTPQALELLNAHFERNTHPSGTEITGLAHQLGYEREVIRIWFCNKRQALKNTVRMMSKGMV